MQECKEFVNFIIAWMIVILLVCIIVGGIYLIATTTLGLIFNIHDRIQERLNEWIVADKNLPDCSGTYLVTAVMDTMHPANIPYKIVGIWAYNSENGNWSYYGGYAGYKVIAWKNVPEGYREI